MRGILADINVGGQRDAILRVLRDRSYLEKVAERLLDYLMRIDDFRGAGRIYVP